ncbi:hypothetical protein M422DRAFT_24502 [Sphaerobolus stellatus SS14]|nr:hypothetical protein M422DRAFT_24502 [Sphaerobolus stellatus SS14]
MDRFQLKSQRHQWIFPYELTLFARSLLLMSFCLTFNVVCWIVSGILFGRNRATRDILSLCVLAWTTGLRHGLDADHISAIDNATRNLININQFSVTCGLYFSLGHSTIVIVVNVAIAISSDVYNKIGGVGTVGGIVGATVSGSFLFIIGLANSIILFRILRRRRTQCIDMEQDAVSHNVHETPGLMMRILGPITTFVNRPWKMYPVGVLFGFGFDTASSIALLAITVLASKGTNGHIVGRGDIVILPFLFTAGMTLVDSADSILMLYSYAGFPEGKKWALIKRRTRIESASSEEDKRSPNSADIEAIETLPKELPKETACPAELPDKVEAGSFPKIHEVDGNPSANPAVNNQFSETITNEVEVRSNNKLYTMSNLSIALTILSILVAFSISLITIMGLIGDNCTQCLDAANRKDGGGLAGSWWRGWARANDNSGYIGAGIVGAFVVLVTGWYSCRWTIRYYRERIVASHNQE